jgi:hypothetical protein
VRWEGDGESTNNVSSIGIEHEIDMHEII